jgi:hypothetical protein
MVIRVHTTCTFIILCSKPLFLTVSQLGHAWCVISDIRKKNVLLFVHSSSISKKRLPIKGRAGLNGGDVSRIPHFVDIRLTDGGEFVSLRRRPSFTPRKIFWYSFLLEAE